MSYTSTTIGDVIDDVNVRYFLPAIQRPFVWTSNQVVALFDSLLKGYPISTFMFWAVEDETKRAARVYRFIEHYQKEAMNDLAATDGRQVVLVLDGQQRLTSLLIGLRGSYAEKIKNARRANPDAWVRRTLYLDLFKDPDWSEDDDEHDLGVTYGLRFEATPPRNSHRQHWIKVGTILDYPSDTQFEALLAEVTGALHHGVTAYERSLVERNLRRLHQAIWRDDALNFYTETHQSLDRVLDIFVRANDSGSKLSKADLLMSMVTSKWSSGAAREDIFGFVDYLNKAIGTPNKATKDFVLKAFLVLGEHDVVYNVSNFTTPTINAIEANWPRIRQAIENTFRLINHHGLSAENFKGLNALLPIVYYLYQNPDYSFRGSSEFERVNAAAMMRWLLNSMFVGAFVGHSDQTITTARATLREHLKVARDFPTEKLFDALAKGGRLSQLDERAIEELLGLKYGKPRTYVALSLLYGDRDWQGTTCHIDHIIPQADANRNVLRGRNLPEHKIKAIMGAADRMGNLQLLPAGENREKGAMAFRSWITGCRRDFLDQHMIPADPELWDVTRLPEFVHAREQLIRERLLSLVGGEGQPLTRAAE